MRHVLRLRPIGRSVGGLAATLLLAGVAQAETLIGLTTNNALVRLDSMAPGAALASVPVSGLAAGDVLVGLDRRPTTGPLDGALYGLARGADGTGRLYRIDEGSGVASLASTLSVPLAGTSFGVDFNPTVDRLRVVSDTGQNLRINVDNGQAIVDGTLAYAPGDRNAGTGPQAVAAAYTNNVGGATTTLLTVLDAATGSFVSQAPPNAGTLNTIANLGFPFGSEAGYDISGASGIGYAALARIGTAGSELFQLGLDGGLSLLGVVRVAGGEFVLRDIAASVGRVPAPATAALLALGAALAFGTGRARRATAGA